jgi:hypothetical protein
MWFSILDLMVIQIHPDLITPVNFPDQQHFSEYKCKQTF